MYCEFRLYDHYMAKGHPIATCMIKRADCYLVKDRMEISGERWSMGSAEAVLRLRNLRANQLLQKNQSMYLYDYDIRSVAPIQSATQIFHDTLQQKPQ
jgi:hypothetical protein